VNYVPGWPQTIILLISASQVAKITGLSHWHPAILTSFLICHLTGCKILDCQFFFFQSFKDAIPLPSGLHFSDEMSAINKHNFPICSLLVLYGFLSRFSI
jgi:hypothetical protein